jgi:hypothetical protein
MVSVQMTDENVSDSVKVDLISHQLHLASLTAVNQEISILNLYQLRGREPAIGRHRATRTEDGDFE